MPPRTLRPTHRSPGSGLARSFRSPAVGNLVCSSPGNRSRGQECDGDGQRRMDGAGVQAQPVWIRRQNSSRSARWRSSRILFFLRRGTGNEGGASVDPVPAVAFVGVLNRKVCVSCASGSARLDRDRLCRNGVGLARQRSGAVVDLVVTASVIASRYEGDGRRS